MENGLAIVGVRFKNFKNKHKCIPSQFANIDTGRKKRAEHEIKHKKKSRSSAFDVGRNLVDAAITTSKLLTEAELKVKNRRLQLEKWKEEKMRQKQIEASRKKKPFLVGVYHAPLKFELPPPIQVPSSSGRVTRSQTAKYCIDTRFTIAPKNAKFNPPQLKNIFIPTLSLTRKDVKSKVDFDPIPWRSSVLTRSQRAALPHTANKQEATTLNERKTNANNKNKSKKMSPKKVKNTAKSTVVDNYLSTNSDTSSNSDLNLKSIQKEKILPKKSKTSAKKLVNGMDSEASSISQFNYRKTPKRTIASKNQVPKCESNSEEKLRSPKSPIDVLAMTPEQCKEAANISPCVTMSRGKENARKEMKQKINQGLLDEDACDASSVQHFRQQLAAEIERITDVCDSWEKVGEETKLPDYVQELLLGAVGQARLLMANKLQQFAGLIERCAAPEPGAGLVTPADLHGFWDMVFMQIENVDLRFKKLEELRKRNWADDEPKQKDNVIKKNPKKTNKPSGSGSNIRGMIAAARKALKQEVKTFEAVFFNVRTPVRTPPAGYTPNTTGSLRKSVLSSEARKASASKNATSYAMMRVSLISKNAEIEGVSPLEQTPKQMTPINFNATPARSILKLTNTASSKKSIKTVLFNDEDEEETTKVEENKSKNDPDKEEGKIEEQKEEIKPEEYKGEFNDSMLTKKERRRSSRGKNRSEKKGELRRQDAINVSPIATRSQRKSLGKDFTIKESKKKPLQTIDINVIETASEITPNKSSRRKKSSINLIDFHTPRRSSRISKHMEENYVTPKEVK